MIFNVVIYAVAVFFRKVLFIENLYFIILFISIAVGIFVLYNLLINKEFLETIEI